MKIDYQILDRAVEGEKWPTKLFWGKDCLPKAESFSWLAVMGRILTGGKRKKFGFRGRKRYVVCEVDEEDAAHLILYFKVASDCWAMLKYN